MRALGIIAGKKAPPRAVDRNRGKRLVREAFRAAAADLGAYDVIVQLRSDLRARDERQRCARELRDARWQLDCALRTPSAA